MHWPHNLFIQASEIFVINLSSILHTQIDLDFIRNDCTISSDLRISFLEPS